MLQHIKAWALRKNAAGRMLWYGIGSQQAADHRGPALDDAARKALIIAGEQWIVIRSGVFGALASFDQTAQAYDIAELVGIVLGRHVPPNSVYRILEIFLITNFVMRFSPLIPDYQQLELSY